MTTPGRSASAVALSWGRRWWLPPALCVLVALGMLLGTPTFGGPDAPVNFATAWYDIHHGLPDNARVADTKLGYHGSRPCFAFFPARPATCHTARSVSDYFSSTHRITNYPPPFLWVVGAGIVAGNQVSHRHAADVGRVVGLLACGCLLVLCAWLLRRRGERSAVWALYLLSPPMATFLYASGNPNAWEICCAFLVASVLLWREDELLAEHPGWHAIWPLFAAALALSTARPSGVVWLLAIVGVWALWSGAWRRWRTLGGLGAAVLPSVVVSLVWSATHPLVVAIGQPTYTITVRNAASRLLASAQDLWTRVVQLWGGLGWNDTLPTAVAVVGLLCALAYFLPTYAPTRRHRGLLVGIIALWFVAAAAWQATSWQTVPPYAWWQERYALPLVAGTALLLFADRAARERPRLFALAGWISVLNAYMIAMNYWRYDYGIINGFPAQVRIAAYSSVHSLAVYVVVALVLAVAAGCFLADRGQLQAGDAVAEAAALDPPRVALG